MAEFVIEKDFDKRKEVEIKLHYPVTVDGETYESLTMRRPNGRDSSKRDRMKGDDSKKALVYFADLCGVSPDVIEELDDVDGEQLGEQLKAFTGRQADR